MSILVAAFAVTASAETVSAENADGTIRIDYDTVSHAMHIVNNGATGDFLPNTETKDGTTFETFMAQYKEEVESVKIDSFTRLNQNPATVNFFSGFTALKSVNFAAGQRIRMRNEETGMFAGCTSLTTVWFGDESNKEDGCINLTGIANYDSDASSNDIIIEGLLKGCTAVTKVILPSGDTYDKLPATTFAGCTALEEVTIPANFLLIAENAFADCENLKVINATVGSTAYKFAEENNLLPEEEYVSLWEQKPDSSLITDSKLIGNLVDWDVATGATVTTNIKYEVHTEVNTLYLYIDGEVTTGAYADNKIITSPVDDAASITLTSKGNLKNVYPFTPYNGTANIINKIVIGDGIEGIDREAFALLSAVTTIELPESFKAINGSAFRGMSALSTVYIRGNTPEAGVIDLSNVTYIDFSTDNTFRGMSSAEYYRFNPEVEVKVDESDYLRYAFYDNTSLKTLDLSNMAIGGIGAYTFQNCTSLEEIYLPASVSTYKPYTNGNASFNDSNSALKAIYAPVGSTMHTYAMANGYDTTHTAEVFNGDVNYATLIFDPDTKKIEIVSKNSGVDFYDSHSGVTDFFDAYSDLVTDIVVGRFSKFRSSENAKASIFSNLPNLISIRFADSQRIYNKYCPLFENCPNLTTVYFGEEAEMKKGVADFSGMNANANTSDRPKSFLNGLFTGCTSLKKVILPAFFADDTYPAEIQANTFDGCTALRSVTIPSSVVGIAGGAFESCTALREIIMEASVDLISETTFTGGTNGLVIYCQSVADANTVNGILKTANVSTSSAFAFYKAGMNSELIYQVRTEIKVTENDDGSTNTVNNGLRTTFNFNKNVDNGDLQLIEYGSLYATKDTWSGYTENFGEESSVLQLSGSEFVTPDKIVKTPIYQNNEFVGKHSKTDDAVSFTVTVVNFNGQDQYKAEIVASGYEIWTDGDNYYVIYTRESAYGYDTTSLYKTTLGMLSDGVIDLEKGDNPIWNVLDGCTKEAIELTESTVSGYKLPHHINDGEYIALYVNTGAEAVEIENLGSNIDDTVTDFIFGKNVSYTALVLDDYWQTHIDEKLATLPEGKSFIIFTDTHFENPNFDNQGKNTRKLADLISYVRKETGIKTVINMGDPYSKENTIEEAEARFKEAVVTHFYDRFGTDGLFVVGNHDANYTRWGKLKDAGHLEANEGQGAYTVQLPDSVIYGATMAHLKGLAEGDDQVLHFDTDMLDLAETLTFKPIGDGEEYTPYYDEETVKEEFIAWVKQHYYYDDHENGIRYIVYNSGNCGLIEYYILNKLYAAVIPTQIKFIANALASVPEDANGNDYDVVFLGHMLGSNEDYNETYADIYKLLSAFKAGTSYTFTYDNSGNAAMNAVVGVDGSYTIDYTGNAYNGTVFSMSGHWHRDLSYVYQTVEGKYLSNVPYEKYNYIADDAIFYIGINNDGVEDPSVPDEPSMAMEDEPTMTRGTTTENCFSI
ncbi:MAG: leucine-rich repeat protein, partial [Clostridia bacterium]|nr:leucine-rich repeat protein [Clostridia bacterium]